MQYCTSSNLHVVIPFRLDATSVAPCLDSKMDVVQTCTTVHWNEYVWVLASNVYMFSGMPPICDCSLLSKLIPVQEVQDQVVLGE